MWFIIGFFIGAFCIAFYIENETQKYGYFTWGGKYYYPEDEIRK